MKFGLVGQGQVNHVHIREMSSLQWCPLWKSLLYEHMPFLGDLHQSHRINYTSASFLHTLYCGVTIKSVSKSSTETNLWNVWKALHFNFLLHYLILNATPHTQTNSKRRSLVSSHFTSYIWYNFIMSVLILWVTLPHVSYSVARATASHAKKNNSRN